MNVSEQPISEIIAGISQQMYDPELRKALRARDPKALAEIGYAPREGDDAAAVEIKVVTSPPGVMHIPLPSLPPDAATLSAEEMKSIQAAGTSNTAGTVGSLSSLGCASSVFSTVSSVSTAGSVGTFGTAGTSGD